MVRRLTYISEARDWSPNITNLNEQLLLGPQREILEIIENINTRWGLNLNATKTYRWGPGYMDKIKMWYRTNYVEEHMKRKISTFFNKIGEKSWSAKELEKKLRLVDEKMAIRRSNGAVFQDNSELLENRLNILTNRVENQLREANSNFNEAGIRISAHLYNFDCDDRYNAVSSQEYIIKVTLPSGKMNLFVGNTPYQIDIGAAVIYFRLDLMKLVYAVCDDRSIITDDDFLLYTLPRSENGNPIIGKYFPEWDENSRGMELNHPYISRYSTWNAIMVDEFDSAMHVCLGQMSGEVDTQLRKLDLISLCATLMVWHSTFHVGRTHPLNQVKYISWGISPQNNTDEFKTAINVANSHNCRHNDTEDLVHDEINYSYCDDLQCVFRDECVTYKAGTGEDYEPVEEPISNPEETWREVATSMEDQIERDHAAEYQAAMEVAIEETTRNRERIDVDEVVRRIEEDRDGEPDVDEGYRRIEEDNETPEERVIRWAAEHGGAINIGERS